MPAEQTPALLVQTRAALQRARLRPNRRAGQCFLVDPTVLERIVAAAGLVPGEAVLEIGAGTGTLTRALAAAGVRVTAVERDRRLAAALRAAPFPGPGVVVVEADALAFDLGAWRASAGGPAKVVANIPYQITSPLLLRLLDLGPRLSLIVLLVQREVAGRLVAQPGSKAYGALTLACRYRAEVEVVAEVPRRAFHPPPEVDSALVRLTPLDWPRVGVPDGAFLFAVIRAALGQRRKTLRNALLGARPLRLDASRLDRALASAAIDGRARGETLSLEDYARLAISLGRAA
jgi:16S rRNA (adenine1518-N6/adenine1519-N6)-dimethyltransferase